MDTAPIRPPFRGFVYIALVEPNLTVSSPGYASRAQKNRRGVSPADRLASQCGAAHSIFLWKYLSLRTHDFRALSSLTATGLDRLSDKLRKPPSEFCGEVPATPSVRPISRNNEADPSGQ